MQKKKARLVTVLTVAVLVGFVVYLGSTQAYGIPIWWVFRGIIPQSVVQPDVLLVTINPISPSQIGENELATVKDASTGQPLQGVNLTVYFGGGAVFSTSTDSQGVASFSYAGSPTIIDFAKSGYSSKMEVIPDAPEQWVNGSNWSAVWASLSFAVSAVGLALQLKVMQHPKGRKVRTRSARSRS